jgi:predicted kinase
MVALFRPDRPEREVMAWYRERTQRCIAQICSLAEELVALGSDVVLELGLIQRVDREPFYEWVDARRHGLTIYVLDAPREVRRQRVERRNREQTGTFCMMVPPDIFELASDLWEPLDARECEERDVRFPPSSLSYACP